MIIKSSQYDLLPTRKPVLNPELIRWLPRWMTNNSPSDLGFIRFGFDLFPKTLIRDYGLADWVRPTMYKVLTFEPGMTKIDRAWAICTSRDFSKTTWMAKILPLYLMLVGQYGIYYKGQYALPEADYIRLRAKTQEKAEEKLTNVTVEFSNPDVISLFGDLRPTMKEIRDDKLKNQAKLMILRNGYIFQGQGLNQPSRGANLRDKRPKVDINDDVENKENTKTHTMRNYNAKEVLGEQFGGLDMQGLTVYIGNFVHQECLMAKLQKPTSGWNRLFFQASYLDPKTGQEKSGWSKRYTLNYIRRLGKWYEGQTDLGGYKIFRMEFYNEIVSDKDYQILYWQGDYFTKRGMNFIRINDGDDKYRIIRVFTVVSGDPAISTKDNSSDGVASTMCFGADGMRYIQDLSLAKFDITDRFYDLSKKPLVLAMSAEEMQNVKRPGLVSEMGRQIVKWNADAFVLENAGQQLAWYNDLVEDILRPLKIEIPGLPYHPVDEKVYKLETGLMNHISGGKYFLRKDMPFCAMAVSQINTFPENKMDILDTWHNGEKMGRKPVDIQFNIANQPVTKAKKSYYDNLPKDCEAWVVTG